MRRLTSFDVTKTRDDTARRRIKSGSAARPPWCLRKPGTLSKTTFQAGPSHRDGEKRPGAGCHCCRRHHLAQLASPASVRRELLGHGAGRTARSRLQRSHRRRRIRKVFDCVRPQHPTYASDLFKRPRFASEPVSRATFRAATTLLAARLNDSAGPAPTTQRRSPYPTFR